MKKRYIFLSVLIVTLGTSFASWANPLLNQISPAAKVNLEMPFRCVLPGTDQQISNTIVLTPDDFSFIPLNAGDSLPRYSVNGYTFMDKPLNEALGELLKNADIKVLAPKSEHALLDGTNVKGELSGVVEQLTQAGDMFFHYQASEKVLTLLPRTEYALNVPKNKVVLMAMLDALHGAQIAKLQVDWEKYQIQMSVSVAELKKAKELVHQILRDSYLLAAEVEGYQIIPYAGVSNWQEMFNQTADLVGQMERAVMGRSVVLKKKVSTVDFLNVLQDYYQVVPFVTGQTVVANGWQMKFNIAECSKANLMYPSLQMILRTRIKDETTEKTKISLYAGGNPLTTFEVNSALNQDVLLMGIPSKVGNAELLFTLKFNLIRLVQKGE